MKDNTMNNKYILFGGYAQFPIGTTGHELFGYFGVGFVVDPDTWNIEEVSSTFSTDISSRLISSVFVGKNIKSGGIAIGIKEFEERYFCKGKKTIIAAIIEAERSFLNYFNR